MVFITQYAAVFSAGLLFIYLIRRWPGRTAFAAIALGALLDCLQIGTSGVTLGVNLYPGDAAGAILLLAGFLAFLRYHRGVPRDAIPCIVLLALVGLNFGRGVIAFGLKPAGNSVRDLFMFTVAAVTVMLLRPVFRFDAWRLTRWLGWAAGILCAIATFRWAGLLPMDVEAEDSLREVVRALSADYALVIALAFVAAVYSQIAHRSRTWGWLAVAVFGGVTVLLQHRSVWVAAAAGVGWLVVRTARSSTRRWLTLATAGAAVLGVIMLARPQLKEKLELLLVANVQETQAADSSWAWRVQGYLESTNRLLTADMTEKLIGPAAGWGANSSGSFASIHIHSRYVSTLASYGIVGFAVLLLWFWVLAKRLARAVPDMCVRDHAGATLLQALLLTELVYLIPYIGGILQGALLGLIWAAANEKNFSISIKYLDLEGYELGCRSNLPRLID